MRGKAVPPAGSFGFGAVLPLLGVGWMLSGCGAQSTAVLFSGAAVHLTQPPSTTVPVVTGTAKKASETLRLADKNPTPPVVTPATLNFGSVQAGSASITLAIAVIAQDHHSVTASLTVPGPFTLTSGAGCASSSSTDCTLAVTFSPTVAGAASADLTVTDATNGLSSNATLTGTGVPIPKPVLSIGSTSLAFAATAIGSTGTAPSILLSNTGNAPLTVSALSVSGAAAGDYSQRNTCAAPLAPGASCSVSVSFSPTATGKRTATLQIASNASAAPAVVVLSGMGTPAPAPVLTLPIPIIAFAPTQVGTTGAGQPLTLANTGDAPLVFSAFAITGSAASEYTQHNTCTAPLAPGTTCTLSALFTPADLGDRAAKLQIVSNASATPLMVSLDGTGTAVPVNQLIPGANAYLPFTETTGSVAHDTSGNGNDCSFGGGNNAPSWNNGGLQFNDGSDDNPRFCSLPASATNSDPTAMNSRTLTLCAYFSPVNAINNRSYAAVLGGSSRMNIGALFLSGDAHVRSAYYMGDYFGYGGVPTYSTQPLVGYHCVTYALGSATDNTLDHFYIDGSEVSSYGAQGTLWDRRAPGDFYQVGAIPWDGGSYLWGTVYSLLTYPTQLTPSSVAHNFAVLQQNSFYARGVGASSVQNTTTANVLVTNGDSLTNQTPGGVVPYPYLLTLNKPFTLHNTAIAGKLLETEVADSPLMDLPLYSPNSRYALVGNAAGINDINVGGSTEAEIAGYRETINASYKRQGFTVLSPTMVSSLGADGETQTINASVRASATANGYFLVDWANEPCLGATGAYANPAGCAYFQADGLHPSQAGETEMARLYSNVVNYLTGATPATPTFVTSAAYTLTAADRFLVAQGTARQTITLPDCYGWSASTPFTVTNANLGGSVVVMPSAGFTLNGGSAAVAIPVAATLQVYADLLSPTASGCAWHTR